jgi:hypothetical protein
VVYLSALTQGSIDPGSGLGAVIAVTAAISTVVTVVAGGILNRRKGKGDFTGEVMKEMEYYRAKTHEQSRALAERDTEIVKLNEQNRQLGQENARLVREEHKEVLERLEALITKAEVTRVGTSGTNTKLDEIHALVNDRLDRALNKIEALEQALSKKDE